MKRLQLLIALYISFVLSGCASQIPNNKQLSEDGLVQTVHLSKQEVLKDPLMVAVYPNGKTPIPSYKIIAKENVSRYNPGGNKRQMGIIHDMLQQLAASVGGDAVINVVQNKKSVSANIVKFDA